MNTILCLNIRFIQPYPLFHGLRDRGEPEWPPSPMRVFQSLLNAACLQTHGKTIASEVRSALHLLEVIHPNIVAPKATISTVGHRAYVPHNQADLVTAAWYRGNNEASIASHRIEKDYRPMRIDTLGDDLPTVHYLYSFKTANVDPQALLHAIRPRVRSIHCLGWGIDQVIADAQLIDDAQSTQLIGDRYVPTPHGGRPFRAPRKGSLDELCDHHERVLNRLASGDWTPVPPLKTFDVVHYRCGDEPPSNPCVVFRLLDDHGDTFSYPQSKLIHIAGMVRHLAIETMKRHPPQLNGIDSESWVRRYIAGHQTDEEKNASIEHRQISYIPLQSLGKTPHTDPSVRRIMLMAPLGNRDWLEHLAEQLDGLELQPLGDQELSAGVFLERVRHDPVAYYYTNPSKVWSSVTPVILDGHDDKKPAKTIKLIELALVRAGIETPCKFEWSAFSRFPKMLSAHKYRKESDNSSGKIQINYIRPKHLLNRTGVHLTLRFDTDVPGPLAIGAGRHCGFGLLAGDSDRA